LAIDYTAVGWPIVTFGKDVWLPFSYPKGRQMPSLKKKSLKKQKKNNFLNATCQENPPLPTIPPKIR